jgi:hypothetical protein
MMPSVCRKYHSKLVQIACLAMVTMCFTPLKAQQHNDSIEVLYPDQIELQDAKPVSSESLLITDTLKKVKAPRDWSKWRPDAKKALWLSLVLPGAGQIYNRKYWKLPIFYGGFVGCIYAISWNNQMYHDYSQAYLDIMDDNPETQSYNSFLHLGTTIDDTNRSRYQDIFKKRKDRYRRWRDLSIFATIAVYALSVVDAYVDASLSEFDISDDLSLRVTPAVLGDKSIQHQNSLKSSAVGVGCSLTF